MNHSILVTLNLVELYNVNCIMYTHIIYTIYIILCFNRSLSTKDVNSPKTGYIYNILYVNLTL